MYMLQDKTCTCCKMHHASNRLQTRFVLLTLAKRSYNTVTITSYRLVFMLSLQFSVVLLSAYHTTAQQAGQGLRVPNNNEL